MKNLRIIEEKMVIGIVPPVAIDKGTAVNSLIKKFQLQGALYLGDDTADVSAFRAIQKASGKPGLQGLAIAVIHKETPVEVITAADFTLDGVNETGLLLKWLVEHNQ
jgi:trehalose 6-phosphate phosphatase